MDLAPSVGRWTLRPPRELVRGHWSDLSPMSMTTTHQTAPTSKGGHCRCHCLPGASRPGLGLPLPLGDPLQLSQVQSVGPQRPPPTSIAPTTSSVGLCGTVKTTNKVPGLVKQEEPEVPNKDPKGFQH